jgi:uncharacterized membrane protein YtjA (UPF0391 family)
MVYWALVFLLRGADCGVFGFAAVAVAAAGIAKLLFVVFSAFFDFF